MACAGCGDAAKKLEARVARLEETVGTLVSGPLELGPDPLAEEVTEAGTPRKDVSHEATNVFPSARGRDPRPRR